MPPDVEAERDAVQVLREAAKGMKLLLILDDCWDQKHASALNCIDATTNSACVITTRVKNLAEASNEVKCGLLSLEESLSLLLKSAGLEHLIDNPPAAAIEACECCGHLALALPIAGGMITELDELWESELVPMLKADLAEELSVEQRIVNASLKCVEQSQRAGVEALFLVFGVFAEDAMVPPAVLDLLAPLVCEIAGVTPASKLKVRKWLAALTKAALLNKAAEAGVSAHDLVRDTMISRAEAREGGLVELQRQTLTLLLAAYSGGSDAASFIIQSIRHHAARSMRPGAALHTDELLMGALCAHGNLVSVSCVSGLRVEYVQAEVNACESAGSWWAAAQLWFALATFRGQRGGLELKQTWAAIKKLESETTESMALERKTLDQLQLISEGGYAFDSAEFKELMKRQSELAEKLREVAATAGADSKASFEALLGDGLNNFMTGLSKSGLLSYIPCTLEVLNESLSSFKQSFHASKRRHLSRRTLGARLCIKRFGPLRNQARVDSTLYRTIRVMTTSVPPALY